MANLKVNTDQIVATAAEIKTINMQIRDEFASVDNVINRLSKTWEGAASNNAIKAFKSIKTGALDARFTAMDHYSVFLISSVSEGYVEAETTNISLAETFK